jgi:hypothetical protein
MSAGAALEVGRGGGWNTPGRQVVEKLLCPSRQIVFPVAKKPEFRTGTEKRKMYE